MGLSCARNSFFFRLKLNTGGIPFRNLNFVSSVSSKNFLYTYFNMRFFLGCSLLVVYAAAQNCDVPDSSKVMPQLQTICMTTAHCRFAATLAPFLYLFCLLLNPSLFLFIISPIAELLVLLSQIVKRKAAAGTRMAVVVQHLGAFTYVSTCELCAPY